MNTNTTTVKRVTKVQRFADIKALLNGKEVTFGTTLEDAIKFIDHEMELSAKKNTSGEKKPTKVQEENEKFKVLIAEFLSKQKELVSCTDILKGIPALNEAYQIQKIPPLVNKLCAEGKAVKEVVKGQSRYRIAEDYKEGL